MFRFVLQFTLEDFIKVIFVKTENDADLFPKNWDGEKYRKYSSMLISNKGTV